MNKKGKILRKLSLGLYGLTGASIVYKGVTSILKNKSIKVAQTKDKTGENKVGYNDVSVINNASVHTNNFVILHVKKEDNIAVLKEKIEFCQENNISIGIVLDTSAVNLANIYEDVDFLQAIVKEYKIDLPVYCNINSIMNSTELNNAERAEIISAFIDKTSRSDMYFGLYGTDSNLNDCNEFIIDTKEYDCYLVQDSEEIKYDGTCNIVEDLNGKITSSLDLSKIILQKGFNTSHELVFSATYTAKENDTYHSLSLKYGLSEEDLRTYNDAKEGELKEGQTIAIPNLYKSINTDTKEVSYNYAIARGIDISNYQNKINWDRVKETSDFVIVEVSRDRSNYNKYKGSYIPECVNQIKNTVENNIELGLYFCISKDMKVSVYEERLEKYLSRLDKELKENNVTLEREDIPVFLDFEVYYKYNDYYKLMTSFERICKEHGFKKIGIYGNASTLKSISSSLNNGSEHIELKDTDWFVWQSGGSQYSSHENTDSGLVLDQIIEPKNAANSQYTTHIRQATNVCKDTGAANSAGNCDLNFCYSTDVFGTSFSKEDISDNYTESVLIDLDQYKGTSATNVINAISSTFIAAGIVVIGAEVVGRFLKIQFANIKQKIKRK